MWSYQTESKRFQDAGTSANQVYVTWGAPQTAPLYQTLVHLGCENAAGDNCANVPEYAIGGDPTDPNQHGAHPVEPDGGLSHEVYP